MRSPFRRIARACLALAGVACAAAALAQPAAQPAAAQGAGALAGGPKHFFWEVSSLTNRVYLFGTVHAGKKEWFPLAPVVEKALEDSKVLVVEADITNAAAMAKSADVMVYIPPDKLQNHVKPGDYARFRKLLERYKLPESVVGQMRPFYAVSVIVFSEWARLGYLPTSGIDQYLILRAKGEAKSIVEIEGIETQLSLLDSLSAAENELAFVGTIDAIEKGTTSEQITGMVNAWQSGDPGLLLEVARRYNTEVPGAKAFEEKFIWSRHESMVKKIEGYLNDSRDRHFIALGALHLAGERGVVEMLRKRGYMVRQR